MAQRRVTIADEVGLHARPAAKFVQAAARFASDIKVRKADRSADAKSMIEVLTLEAGKGDEIVLEATGADADAAVQALVTLLEGDGA
jgi:phosphotransferase system HPr (HPr) family protein